MILNLDWEIFRTRILVETNTSLIFYKVVKSEDGRADYSFFTSIDYGLIVATKVTKLTVEDALIFEGKYLTGHKLVPIVETMDKDIILNITKGENK